MYVVFATFLFQARYNSEVLLQVVQMKTVFCSKFVTAVELDKM
jgi:hypothetical protein